jgi:hypothetical protein
MIGAEQAALPGRLHPIYLEGRPFVLEMAAARDLGLRDGQIIQATAAMRGDSLKMLLNGRYFDLPPGLRFSPGEAIWLRAQVQAGGWLLRPVGAPQANLTAEQAGASAAAAATLHASRLESLSLRPPMSSSLMSLFQPAMASALLQLAANPELAALFQRMRLSLRGLSGAALQAGVQHSGFWLESMLAQGQAVAGYDTKSWLRRMIRALGDRESPEKAGLERALDDMESAQVESLAAQARGEIAFAMVLPFKDANPVEVQFFRPARRPGQEAPPFTVNIHTENALLGEIWLKTSITRASHVDLMMWALRADVVALAHQHSEALSKRLREAGLTMESFRIFNAARPNLPESWTPPGAMLDVSA